VASRSELSAKITRTLFEVLDKHPEGVHKNTLWNLVLGANPGLEEAWRKAVSGKTTPFTHMSWMATEAVKAGWMRKDGDGTWELTGAGRHTLAELDENANLKPLIKLRYHEWKRAKDSYDLAGNVLQSLPEGRWVGLKDLAEVSGLDPVALMQYLSAARTEGWHRVLDEEGRTPECAHLTDEEQAAANALLDADGILGPNGWTLGSHRLSWAELTEQVSTDDTTADEASPPARAWLVRGTDPGEDGSVHTSWVERGVCSLTANGVDTLRAGVGETMVRDTVERLHQHWTAEERERLVFALHSFVSKMRSGDLVLTNVGRQVHLGMVDGEELDTDAPSAPHRLVRKVVWHTRSAPLDLFEDLSAELASRVGTPNSDLLELTGFREEMEALVGGSRQRPQKQREFSLPEPTEEFARSVFMDRAWLAECVDLLRDKPQLVLYGPPGTGKTHLAQELARHLTGDRPENCQLVQFHPSYSYEDFFEGYRPHPGDAERSAGFTLTPGPLRTLASAARKHPAEPFVLIIDEINRGNLAKVFGELYFLLEYRNRSVRLLYGSEGDAGFDLPRNLIIIGTMNTADRSIALVDTAMRRRFWFTELHPSSAPVSSVLRKWLEHHDLPETPALLLDALNDRIDDRDFRIGPSYLMRTSIHSSPTGLERVWRHQILPLLEEHHYGDGTDVEARYGLASLRRSLPLNEQP
jgi:5-methylcytosine-specific restriction protein B